MEKDKRIAQETSGIDIIIGGHTHDLLQGIEEGKNLLYSKSNEPVIITQAGKDGEYFGDLKIIHYPNFQFSLLSERYRKVVDELDRYVETLDDDVIYFLRGSENYFYKIKSNSDITYFDLPNYGNYGYDGTLKIISRLKSVANGYFVIDKEAYEMPSPPQQYLKEAVDYIMTSGVKVKTIGVYEIYYLSKE